MGHYACDMRPDWFEEPQTGKKKPSTSTVKMLPPTCAYCHKPDAGWMATDLANGKRGLPDGSPGVEYHCLQAFYLNS